MQNRIKKDRGGSMNQHLSVLDKITSNQNEIDKLITQISKIAVEKNKLIDEYEKSISHKKGERFTRPHCLILLDNGFPIVQDTLGTGIWMFSSIIPLEENVNLKLKVELKNTKIPNKNDILSHVRTLYSKPEVKT